MKYQSRHHSALLVMALIENNSLAVHIQCRNTSSKKLTFGNNKLDFFNLILTDLIFKDIDKQIAAYYLD